MSANKLARKARLLRWAMNLYPPYLGAGVRVRQISADFRQVQVKMGLGWYNRNYVGTQFGGSLYSMTDPFFMLMIMENLGRDFIVWDKAARIDFIAPGKGPVYADFSINEQLLVGHFDLWHLDGSLVFRNNLLLSGNAEANDAQCEALIRFAVDTCERYFPAVQFVVWAGQPAEQALESAMIDTWGEA